ncbi:MAG: class I SAM-dependent RNA methyltransferase [Tenericutes bacterium]|nr:class I SAM-dependent RNA methyltransferase [Mycoplasmatota bacterium]
MKVNSTYIVDVVDDDINGNGIARIDNFVIFISSALKGEKLKIEITNIKKRYATAKIIEIIKSSNDRINIKCSKYKDCGGCSFLHINNNYEDKIKINYINKLFNINENKIYSDSEYNYRNKATFHVNNNIIGYYSENSHKIVSFDKCLLLDERINNIYNYFKNIDLKDINEVIVRTTKSDIMISIKSNNKIFDYNDLLKYYNINSIYLNNKLIYGEKYIIENINDKKYVIFPDAFFQVNRENMIIMYDIVKLFASKGDKLLDLYCGTGTIGIYLSDNYNSILGIDINNSSIECANINASINMLNNIKFIAGDSKIAKTDNYDTIIVDPPRVGLSKEVINYINNSKCKKIIYISCNPNTLKKDLELLNNYSLEDLKIINMFNKTKHVECVSLLKYRS